MTRASCPEGKIGIGGKCKDKSNVTVQELAGEYSQYFQRKKRDNGKEFITLKDDRPEELHELVREAHGKDLPDDYKYEFTERAIDDIADSEDPEEEASERIDAAVDVYNHDLLEWLGSTNTRHGYVDEAVEEMGHGEGVMKEIMMGQYREREEVYQLVLQGLKNILED